MFANKNITEIVHDIISGFIIDGCNAIDATSGNGNDTLFMANAVGEDGKVYAFDIQTKAIETTKDLLLKNNINNAVLINDGHENIDRYNIADIQVAIFNLGYLPNGDKGIITTGATTISAIGKCLEKLNRCGAVVVVSYYAHIGGIEEKDELELFLGKLDKNYLVTKINFFNRPNKPPNVYIIERHN